MTRARELSKLGNINVIAVDSSNNIGIGSTTPDSKMDLDGEFIVGSGASITTAGEAVFAGVVTASSFSGGGAGLSGIATGVSINAAGGAVQRVVLVNATSGVANTMANTGDFYYNNETSTLTVPNVSISGTMTHSDVTEIDSVGLVTAGLGLRVTKGGVVVTAGVATFTAAIDANSTSDFAGNVTVGAAATVGLAKSLSLSDNAFINFGDADDMQIYHDGSNSYIVDRGTGELKITGSVITIEGTGETLAKFTDDGAAELYHNNSKKAETIGTGLTVTGGVNASGLSTFQGASFTPGDALKETIKITSTAWNSSGDCNVSNGNLVYNSGGPGAGGADLNIVSDVGINTTLKVGEMITFAGITSASNTSHYIDGLKIDHATQVINWIGGSAPSEGGGSGFDIYNFTIIKTGDAAYSIIGNHTKTAA